MLEARFDYVLPTVAAICQSSAVKEYVVGVTAQPGARRRAYRDAVALLYPHFVLLVTGLLSGTALALERELQIAIRTDPACYRKCHRDRRDAAHRASLGGSERYRGERAYSLYMAWRDG